MSKKIELEDILGEASSFVQAIYLAAAGLGSPADMCAIQMVAGEASDRLKRARCIIDNMPDAVAVTAEDILAAVKAEQARRAALMGEQS